MLGYTFPLAGLSANAKMVSNMVASLNTDWLIDIYSEIGNELGSKNLNKTEILQLFEESASNSEPANIFYFPLFRPMEKEDLL